MPTPPNGAAPAAGGGAGGADGALAEGSAKVPTSLVVAVRVRPAPDGAPSALVASPTTVTLSPGKNEHAFAFDHVFGDDAPTEQVYRELGAPVLRKALDGFNGTIFAYGQTGSGKTFTMTGGGPGCARGCEDGIIPRLSDELFYRVDQEAPLVEVPGKELATGCSVRVEQLPFQQGPRRGSDCGVDADGWLDARDRAADTEEQEKREASHEGDSHREDMAGVVGSCRLARPIISVPRGLP